MKLEMATFPVKDVKFSGQTDYKSEVLQINKEELVKLILEDKRVASADLDIAFPGEQTRIVNVRDVVEPRVKVSGPGCVFPGIMGPVETVGEGRTHRLSGVTVIPSAEYRPTVLSGSIAQDTSILDMWGPAVQLTPFASTINVVPIFKLVDGVTELEAHNAIQMAEFKVAHRLAEATRDLAPEGIEVFELFKVDPALPKVIYIAGIMTNWHAPHSYAALYGLIVRESLPTFIHPSEVFDGAVTKDTRKGISAFTYTWGWLNHPVILELFREHGKRLNFLGIILQRTRFEAELGKQVTAACTSQMARLLGADGAIITRTVGSGANFVDVMLTVQACEKKGIETIFLTPEWGGKDGTEQPFVFYTPEAVSMVSTGSTDLEFKFSRPEKVIGLGKNGLVQLDAADEPFSPWDEFCAVYSEDSGLTGISDWFGGWYSTRI